MAVQRGRPSRCRYSRGSRAPENSPPSGDRGGTGENIVEQEHFAAGSCFRLDQGEGAWNILWPLLPAETDLRRRAAPAFGQPGCKPQTHGAR
jgi:hypothetical protein